MTQEQITDNSFRVIGAGSPKIEPVIYSPKRITFKWRPTDAVREFFDAIHELEESAPDDHIEFVAFKFMRDWEAGTKNENMVRRLKRTIKKQPLWST